MSDARDTTDERQDEPQPSITCPVCLATSYSPTDIADGYCSRCHDWTSPVAPNASRR
jgi:hypothetical protein